MLVRVSDEARHRPGMKRIISSTRKRKAIHAHLYKFLHTPYSSLTGLHEYADTIPLNKLAHRFWRERTSTFPYALWILTSYANCEPVFALDDRMGRILATQDKGCSSEGRHDKE